MRSWERQPKESEKAFEAFKIYRDLGHERSLHKAATLYYGSTANIRNIERWSKLHDWRDRARAHDDWLEMVRQDAIEQHERTKTMELAERRSKLQERAIALAESAADQMEQMLDWPLAIKEVVREEDDGKPAIYRLIPARWSKHTAREYFDIIQGAIGEDPARTATDDSFMHGIHELDGIIVEDMSEDA